MIQVMKRQRRRANPHCAENSPPGWLCFVAACLLAGLLQLLCALRATAEDFPLPPWNISGGGINGTWDGASASPDQVQLAVAMNPPAVPNQHVTVTATSANDLLQITPATTYSLTCAAAVWGSANCEAFMLDGTTVITNATIYGTWKRYTNSFTTGGPADPLVGRQLKVQLVLMKSGFNYGSATATFTNIQFAVSTIRPRVTRYRAAAEGVWLLWPTNFYWYIPEYATNLQASVWESITNLPTIEGDLFAVRVETKTGPYYFRLRQP